MLPSGWLDLLVRDSLPLECATLPGRTDNIFVERLWRSLKYEEVYLKDYETVKEAKDGIKRYFDYYNNERPPQGLDYDTPAKVYLNTERES